MLLRMRKAQSTAEYAIVIGLVIAAAVAMQVYVKRGIQGKMKDAVDYNDPSSAGMFSTQQFEPDYMTVTGMKQTKESEQKKSLTAGGGVKSEIVGEDVMTRDGGQQIIEAPSATP